MTKFVREDWSPRFEGPVHETTFHAVADQPDEVRFPAGRQHRAASVSVRLAREVPLINQTDRSGNPRSDDTILRHTLTSMGYQYPEIHPQLLRQQQTPQMFQHVPAIIDSAFAHPSMRGHVPTLFGMAINAAGGSVMASDSLSKHSSPLVKRALEAGLLVPNPKNREGDVTNEYDFDDVDQTVVYMNSDGQPKGGARWADPRDVTEGSRVARQFIRKNRTDKLSPQFAALKQLDEEQTARQSGKVFGSEGDPNAPKLPGL